VTLNLPVLDQLSSCKSLLIAGIGSGFDVYCGLPVYFELRGRGQSVHLANVSFAPNIGGYQGGVRLSPTLVGVTAKYRGTAVYFPELHLARWFQAKLREDVPIWYLELNGVRSLLADYRLLARHLGLDGILLIDGGVDSLIRGDEEELATVLEDATSLAAVEALTTVPVRLLACLGFGAEREVPHAQVFENIAALEAAAGFLGSCSLTAQMKCYQLYEDAVRFAHDQPNQDPSVINASVVSSVRGRFGDYHLTEKTRGSRLWISPLMSVYWFFSLTEVVRRNLFLPALAGTTTYHDALTAMFAWQKARSKRPLIPIGLR
jgi:hypothetical protein